MGVSADRIKRFWRSVKRAMSGNLSVWLPAVAVVAAIGGILGLAFSVPAGTYQYCSDMLVRCIRDIPADAGGFAKMKATGVCSFQTVRCDLETLHYALMREEKPFSAADPTDGEQAKVLKRLLSEDVQEERTAELRRLEAESASKADSEDLNAEMIRLRREREAFEAEQKRFKKLLYETLVKNKESAPENNVLTRQTEK